jgi:hypothetical protein
MRETAASTLASFLLLPAADVPRRHHWGRGKDMPPVVGATIAVASMMTTVVIVTAVARTHDASIAMQTIVALDIVISTTTVEASFRQ